MYFFKTLRAENSKYYIFVSTAFEKTKQIKATKKGKAFAVSGRIGKTEAIFAFG